MTTLFYTLVFNCLLIHYLSLFSVISQTGFFYISLSETLKCFCGIFCFLRCLLLHWLIKFEHNLHQLKITLILSAFNTYSSNETLTTLLWNMFNVKCNVNSCKTVDPLITLCLHQAGPYSTASKTILLP